MKRLITFFTRLFNSYLIEQSLKESLWEREQKIRYYQNIIFGMSNSHTNNDIKELFGSYGAMKVSIDEIGIIVKAKREEEKRFQDMLKNIKGFKARESVQQ